LISNRRKDKKLLATHVLQATHYNLKTLFYGISINNHSADILISKNLPFCFSAQFLSPGRKQSIQNKHRKDPRIARKFSTYREERNREKKKKQKSR